MKIQRTTRITIEQQRVRTVSVDRCRVLSGSCERCRRTVAVFTAEAASAILRVDLAEISVLISTAQIHLVEMQSGTPLICGRSLMGSSR